MRKQGVQLYTSVLRSCSNLASILGTLDASLASSQANMHASSARTGKVADRQQNVSDRQGASCNKRNFKISLLLRSYLDSHCGPVSCFGPSLMFPLKGHIRAYETD
eukprot:1640185-Amphidinium_carterae.1